MIDRQERGASFPELNVDRKDLDCVVVEETPPGRPRVSRPRMQLKRRCIS
jgi:hypothetical protein